VINGPSGKVELSNESRDKDNMRLGFSAVNDRAHLGLRLSWCLTSLHRLSVLPRPWLLIVVLIAVTTHAEGHASTTSAAADQTQGILPIPDYGGDIWDRGYLTGDWGGTRTEWANKGVQFVLEYLGWVGSVVDGGLNDDTEAGNNITYKVKLDLMRAGILPGALIDVRAETRYGNNTNPYSGTTQPHFTASLVPVDYTDLQRDADFTITNLTYTQFLSEHFGVFAGKVDTFETGDPNEFASGRGRTQFNNYNLNYGPQTLIVPASTMAVGALYLPNEHLTLSSAVLSATDCSYNSCFDDAYDDGTIWANAAMFQYRLGDLPGGANVNAIYFFDTDFTELGTLAIDPGDGNFGAVTSEEDESWMVILSFWQYLSAESVGEGPLDLLNQRPDLQGWGIFGRLGFADEDTNPFETSISVGIGGRGVIHSRPNDVFGIGYFYNDVYDSNFTNSVGFDGDSSGVEAFYNLAITPAARFSINLQYLESSLKDEDDATVLIGRLHLVF
jgi:porin